MHDKKKRYFFFTFLRDDSFWTIYNNKMVSMEILGIFSSRSQPYMDSIWGFFFPWNENKMHEWRMSTWFYIAIEMVFFCFLYSSCARSLDGESWKIIYYDCIFSLGFEIVERKNCVRKRKGESERVKEKKRGKKYIKSHFCMINVISVPE